MQEVTASLAAVTDISMDAAVVRLYLTQLAFGGIQLNTLLSLSAPTGSREFWLPGSAGSRKSESFTLT